MEMIMNYIKISTHQSKKGAYLSAICIYKALTNEDPTNIKYYAGISSTTVKKDFKKLLEMYVKY